MTVAKKTVEVLWKYGNLCKCVKKYLKLKVASVKFVFGYMLTRFSSHIKPAIIYILIIFLLIGHSIKMIIWIHCKFVFICENFVMF